MNDHMLNFSKPFILSTKEVFKVMMGIDLVMHSPRFKETRVARGDITSIIAVIGEITKDQEKKDFSGLLAFSFSENVFLAIASKMLGEEYSEYNEEISDVGSEIANIVLGKSKPALVELGFKVGMSSPSTIAGKNHQISFPEQGHVIEITVDSELGSFTLDISYVG